jgi:hypothetical protein
VLEKELRFYEQHQTEWAATYAGKLVLVKDADLIGVFDTLEDALAEGARRFGLNPFLVRPADEPSREISITTLAVGALHADPSYPVQRH